MESSNCSCRKRFQGLKFCNKSLFAVSFGEGSGCFRWCKTSKSTWQENPLLYPITSNLYDSAEGPKDLLMRMADRTENLEDGETRLFQGGWLVTCHG